MSIYFISDIHLQENHPFLTEKFFYFLKNCVHHMQALYILGDLFDAWIGDDNRTDFNIKIMESLSEITHKNIPVFFIHGNRDFLIGKKFSKATGIQLLPEHSIVTHYGKNLLLLHGDTLCTDDLAYQKFRKKMRSPLVQMLFLLRTLKRRRNFAKKAREKSKIHQQKAPLTILDATESAVKKAFEHYDIQYMIHGHTHQPGIHLYYENQTINMRMVLSDWHTQGNFLKLDEEGVRLMYF